MPTISTERWTPSPEDPGKRQYDGQRTAYEVFVSIQEHLSAMGYLPDEYFLLDDRWRDGAPFPRDGWLTHSVDFGGSEGIYLDTALHWEDKDRKQHTKHFFTGKTLGEGAEDLNRMHLAAAAITQAFQPGSAHARYLRGGGNVEQNGLTIQLNADERELLADALMEYRSELKITGAGYKKAEQLLRRLVGSITSYMQLVGKKPVYLDDYDKVELAIKEYDMEVFLDTYPKVLGQMGNLLYLAASQPGQIGRHMVDHLIMDAKDIPADQYQQICINALRTGDTGRVIHLLDHADECSPESGTGLLSQVMKYAYTHTDDNFRGGHFASVLLDHAGPEQVAGISSDLLVLALQKRHVDYADRMLRKGVDVSRNSGEVFYTAALHGYTWLIRQMQEQGHDIDAQNSQALRYALVLDQPTAARALLDSGADFNAFAKYAETHMLNSDKKLFIEDLRRYHDQLQEQSAAPQPAAPMQEQSM